MSILNDFDEKNLSALHDILITLLDKENLSMKTEIHNPEALATLRIISLHYKYRSLEIPYKILRAWINFCNEYNVSKDRKSRKEIVKALQTLNERIQATPKTLKDKLIGKV